MTHQGVTVQAEMTALVAELAPDEGMTPSLLDGVWFGRANQSLPRAPVLHEPCVMIVSRAARAAMSATR